MSNPKIILDWFCGSSLGKYLKNKGVEDVVITAGNNEFKDMNYEDLIKYAAVQGAVLITCKSQVMKEYKGPKIYKNKTKQDTILNMIKHNHYKY